MGKSSRSVRTRSRSNCRRATVSSSKLVPVLCERPVPDDWKSPDTSRNDADVVSANLFEERNQGDATFVYLSSLSLSLSISASVCCFLVCLKMTNGIGMTTWLADVVVLKKKQCGLWVWVSSELQSLGPRRTRLELSLCVTGDSSVLLPLLQLQRGGAVANRLRRRTSDQTVLGSNPAVAAALSPWTRLFTPIVPRRSLHISFY